MLIIPDSSYHPPPVPVVVLDPDGRVTVAYLLRVSNQSYLVTQKSDASGSSGSRGDLANRSLSLPTTLPPDRSLSLPASQPAERSLSPPPGWPFRSACPLSPALSANASLAPSEERSSSGSLPAGMLIAPDASCHPPPVPVVVLDPDGRVTVAYLLRASNQSYLVTHTSKDDSRASLGDRSLSPPLSAAGPAASLPPAEQQRSADEQISGSDSSMSGGITAAGSGPGCGECNEDGAASAESGTEPDLEKGSTSEAEELSLWAVPVPDMMIPVIIIVSQLARAARGRD
ncbi:hypothetical protein C2E21_5953 [Chlorella sorokiniana]|uniref:Uncharacterized protein n=1 Tax=Chlorella sorokiniana TaxID=3076 RepID=A0A2P6TMR6_CHLSO|nr:hypothetical protein C2E21_5953 [Chlorella sorokiniana]|eukprot:PRW45634.1 hypothetical protein C2E21_5953 [Chlorella sorokiniana]